ncbi:ABC transporter permease [Marispirochaeta aestuarii]|uniref:ABC transporter permease n=1 Tax=Marispirochaeta aestuarii TaxID=1963862 RepID=UPI0029C7C7EF|nr:ABC transporter permease [Marispirochaeta aestuarii]
MNSSTVRMFRAFRAFRESLVMSLRSIGSNKVRSFLTALGVMIGVAAVIALVALGNGAQLSVQQSLESLGSNLLLVYSGEPRGGSLVRRSTTNITPTLSEDDLNFIRALGPELVVMAAPESSATAQLKYGSVNTVATVIGTGTGYPDIRNFHPVHGQFFSELDVDTRKAVAVIGVQVYRDLFPEGVDPLGQSIRINGINHRVVGIMEEKGSSTSDAAVFIPISTYQRYISGERNYALINVQAASTEVMRDLQRIIENGILIAHRLPGMDSADFYIANQLDLLSTMQGVTETFTVLLGSIAAISLIVGGIGIMNIMLVSVTERTREIGVRMALGARGSDILQQFITEAVIISLIGGLVGIALGVGASWAVSRFGGMAARVSLDSVVLAFGFAFIIGLFFGGYPAFRASRLDPIEALRYE